MRGGNRGERKPKRAVKNILEKLCGMNSNKKGEWRRGGSDSSKANSIGANS